MNSQIAQGRPRGTWIDDIKSWLSLDSCEQTKNTAQDRNHHGESVSGQHVNLLHRKTTADANDDEQHS